jgi:hypothetical protein
MISSDECVLVIFAVKKCTHTKSHIKKKTKPKDGRWGKERGERKVL